MISATYHEKTSGTMFKLPDGREKIVRDGENVFEQIEPFRRKDLEVNDGTGTVYFEETPETLAILGL